MSKDSRLGWLAALLAILAWMLIAHPYEGLRHDGVLYFGQVLLHSRVPALGRDVFFAGGSQDQYSIYAHVVAPLYDRLGVLPTHIVVLLAGWLLMAGAVLALLRHFQSDTTYWLWGLLSFAVLSPIYGGGWVFSYGEAFVTARSFAEPLLLWSLVALLGDRRIASLSLQLLAALFHPLMALPIMVVSWCYLVGADRRWLWALAVIPVLLFASLAGVPPWDGLLKTYDPYWWALVETGNRQVLIENWTLEDKLTILLDLSMLIAASRLRAPGAWTRLIHAVVITAVALIGLTALGADDWHSILLTQLQLWRAHWIAHLLAMALAPWVLATLWRLGGLWPVSACALALALLNSHVGTTHGAACLALWALASLAAWRVREVSRASVLIACGCIVICIVALSVYQLDGVLEQQNWQYPTSRWEDRFIKVAAFPTIALPCFAALLHLARKGRTGPTSALVLSALLWFASLASWDQRTDLARAVESPIESTHPFAAHMAGNATVYWPNQLIPVWGLLERASHYSQQQGAGVLFNRDTGLVFGPRREMYRRINEDYERCRSGAMLSRDRLALLNCEMPAKERLLDLCHQPDAPDFMVLEGRLRREPIATWRPPAKHDLPQRFSLYACSQLTTRED